MDRREVRPIVLVLVLLLSVLVIALVVSACILPEDLLRIDDVDTTHPNWEDIKIVVQAEVLPTKESCESSKLTGKVYCPNDRITRDEFVLGICKAKYEPGSIPVLTSTFLDRELEENIELASCIEQLIWDSVMMEDIETLKDPGSLYFDPHKYVKEYQKYVYHLRGIHGGGWQPPDPRGAYHGCPVGFTYSPWCVAYVNEGYHDTSQGVPQPNNYITRADAAPVMRVYLEEYREEY